MAAIDTFTLPDELYYQKDDHLWVRVEGDVVRVGLERGEVLAAFQCVDMVVIFEEPDPLAVIEQLQPDILVKGADWSRDQIIGADFVEAQGGRVVSVPLLEGKSTTGIIERILAGPGTE